MAPSAKTILSERSLATVLLCYGLLTCAATANAFSVLRNRAFGKAPVSLLDIVALLHLPFLLSILAILASLWVFRGSVLGWIGSICAWSFASFHLLMGAIRNSIKGCIDYTSPHAMVNAVLILIGFGCSVYLLRNARPGYRLSKRRITITWLTAVMFVLDEIILLYYTT